MIDLDRFVDEHEPMVRRYARARLPRADVDDVVVEVFTVAWRRRDEIPTPPQPWLLGVTRKVVSTAYRSAHRRAALMEKVAPTRAPVYPDHAAGVVTSEAMLAAISRLRSADRDVVLAMMSAELTTPQLGEVLGCSRSAATMRLSRARARFKDALVAEHYFDNEASAPSFTAKEM